MVKQTESLLLIFTRNPEPGKCKTRLAKTIGNSLALEIYIYLLNHTVSITKEIKVEKEVHYSEEITEGDMWSETIFNKKKQEGEDLGAKMEHAFKEGFEAGFKKIVIIGSDIYDLSQSDIEKAFSALDSHDIVIGPAFDGGYYLLGMKKLNAAVFRNKNWGKETVLNETMKDLEEMSVTKLGERNDIDIYEDIENIDVFQKLIRRE